MIFDIDTYGSRLAIIADDGIKWREICNDCRSAVG